MSVLGRIVPSVCPQPTPPPPSSIPTHYAWWWFCGGTGRSWGRGTAGGTAADVWLCGDHMGKGTRLSPRFSTFRGKMTGRPPPEPSVCRYPGLLSASGAGGPLGRIFPHVSPTPTSLFPFSPSIGGWRHRGTGPPLLCPSHRVHAAQSVHMRPIN